MAETERERQLLRTIRELERANAGLAREVSRLTREMASFRAKLDRLLAENTALRDQLLGGGPRGTGVVGPNTPSSQVPPYLKSQPTRRPKRPGRRKGHKGVARPEPEQIDRTEAHQLQACPHCDGPVRPLRSRDGRIRVRVRYIEEVPERTPEVTEHQIHRYYCARCQRTVEPPVTAALPGARLGLMVVARTAVQHYLYGIPTAKDR